MLVSKEIFLEALKRAKNNAISVRTIDKTGMYSKQWYKISELNYFRNVYGKLSLALILLPLSDSPVVVIEFHCLAGIKLERMISVQNCSADEMTTSITETTPH